MAAMLNN